MPGPILDLYAALTAPLQTVQPAWWGVVVSDERYPALWDANQAMVADAEPALAEVEEALIPAMREVGAPYEHVVVPHPGRGTGLLKALEERGDEIAWDLWMRNEGVPGLARVADVEEITVFDEPFWEIQRVLFSEFALPGETAEDLEPPEQLDQFERMQTELGKRWFAALDAGDRASYGALQVFGDIAYLDNIVTVPAARGRGFATAVVTRLVAEARVAGATEILLLTEASNPARRLYERCGFAVGGRIASTLRRLE